MFYKKTKILFLQISVMSARAAIKISFISNYGSTAIQFITSVVIARLLLPSEVGIYSIGMALFLMGQTLREFGTAQFIIQEADLTIERIRAAYTVTLVVAWLLAFLLFVSGPFAASFYEEPGIEELFSLLSVSYLLLPFGTITAAYLRRQMNFMPVMIACLGSSIVTAVVSIASAFAGLSYMSLAWGGLAGTATTILIINLYRPPEIPLLPGTRGIRRVLSFGSRVTVVELLENVSNSLPELVMGKTLGMHTVGIFSRAQGVSYLFSRLIMQSVGPVITPFFADKKRKSENICDPYIMSTTYITGMAWPFLGTLTVLAHEFVLVIYGQNWVEAAPLLRVLCVALMIYYITGLAERVLIATGEVKRLFRFGLVFNTIRIVLLTIAAFVNVYLVAVVIGFSFIVRFFLIWRDLQEVVGVSIRDYILICRQSGLILIATVSGVLLSTLALKGLDVSNAMLILCCGLGASGVFWIASVLMFKHPLYREILAFVERMLLFKKT